MLTVDAYRSPEMLLQLPLIMKIHLRIRWRSMAEVYTNLQIAFTLTLEKNIEQQIWILFSDLNILVVPVSGGYRFLIEGRYQGESQNWKPLQLIVKRGLPSIRPLVFEPEIDTNIELWLGVLLCDRSYISGLRYSGWKDGKDSIIQGSNSPLRPSSSGHWVLPLPTSLRQLYM